MSALGRIFGVVGVIGIAACGGGRPAASSPPAEGAAPPSANGAPAPSTVASAEEAPASATVTGDDQAAEGAKLYAAHCAGCHGDGGEGNARAPALVGKSALPLDPAPPSRARTAKFHTAADVFAFVKETMPPKKPGSLTDEQYAAILAFDLKANGVDLKGRKLDATWAKDIVIHP